MNKTASDHKASRGYRPVRAKRVKLLTYFLVGGGLVLLFAASAAALYFNKVNEHADELVRHTITVLSDARSYQSGVQGAVISERAFLITGDEQYLTDYEHAIQIFSESKASVRELTRDSAVQQLRLDELETTSGEIIALLQRTIGEMQSDDHDESINFVRNNNIDAMLAEFNDLIERFINEERLRLRERRTEQRQTQRRVGQIILTALVLIAGLLLLQVVITREQNQLQQTRNKQIMAINAELEERVALRTRELEAAKTSLEEENLRVEALLRDLHHRVGNSLQLVASFLGLQASRVEGEEAKTTLRAARERVLSIAATQRRLRFSSDHETVDAHQFINMIVEDLRANLAFEQNIEIETEIDEIIIPSRDAVSIGILVSELVTNAVKYAFRGLENGVIKVRFEKESGGEDAADAFRLTVEDDGVGMADAQTDPHGGLGMQIIQRLVMALGGELNQSVSGEPPRPGARATVSFSYE